MGYDGFGGADAGVEEGNDAVVGGAKGGEEVGEVSLGGPGGCGGGGEANNSHADGWHDGASTK